MSQENVELAQTLGNLYNERGFATGKSWSTRSSSPVSAS